MLLIADTSALVALASCDSLALLEPLLGTVRVPAAVFEECIIEGKPEATQLARFLADKVVRTDLRELIIAVSGLGKGELEAMALLKQLAADRLLVDDHRARKVARCNGIAVIGSLGVLLEAKRVGLVPALRPLLRTMGEAGGFYSEHLLAQALALADEG